MRRLVFQTVRKVAVVGMFGDTVGIEQQNVARAEQRPLVHLVRVLEAERTVVGRAVDRRVDCVGPGWTIISVRRTSPDLHAVIELLVEHRADRWARLGEFPIERRLLIQ